MEPVLVSVFSRFAIWIIGLFFKNHAHSEQARRDYIAFMEIMHKHGLASVKMRLDAVEQIDRIAEKWKTEKELEKKEGPLG